MRHNTEDQHQGAYAHVSVMWREVLQYVSEGPLGPRGIFVDCTLGEGGHTEIICQEFPEMRVIAFERDEEILQVAKKRLAPCEGRITFVNDNFSRAADYLREGSEPVAYMLYDFGISSFHFDRSGRGFSFQEDEPLDMRLDHRGLSAAEIVNTWREDELGKIFREYGEERYWRRVAGAIVARRKEGKFTGTRELADVIKRAIPGKPGPGPNIHPATRVFQALRIQVNRELDAIDETLRETYRYLQKGGRIMAISFHSLEDRIVKNRFRRLSKGCTCDAEAKHCQCNADAEIKILTKKPLQPQQDEIDANRRARSARLRVIEKL